MADRNIANNLPRYILINQCHRVLLAEQFRILFTKRIRLQVTFGYRQSKSAIQIWKIDYL